MAAQDATKDVPRSGLPGVPGSRAHETGVKPRWIPHPAPFTWSRPSRPRWQWRG